MQAQVICYALSYALIMLSDAKAAVPTLQAVFKNSQFELRIQQPEALSYFVEAGSSLGSFNEVSLLVGSRAYSNSFLPFIDAAPFMGARFYRVSAQTTAPDQDWKNSILYPEDAFLSKPDPFFNGPQVRWIKFAITTNEPYRVYFQDSAKYLFHYDFAAARLPAFKGMTRDDFDAVSLHTNAQKVVLGTILYPANTDSREVAIQLVGSEPYSREQVAEWLRIVRCGMIGANALKIFYFPVYEQAAIAEENRDYFAQRGFEVGNVLRWTGDANVYSLGWALGTLKYIPTADIQAAYTEGRLGPLDILLTDDIPAELPYVSGILSLNPATPNSHVAILAGSYGVPFGFLSTAELKSAAQGLLGKQVILSTQNQGNGGEIRLLDASNLSADLRAEMLAARKPAPIQLAPKERYGDYIASADQLTPADLKYFGGKASNYGFLRRSIPTNSAEALAISFDLWEDFLDQVLSSGKTLRQEITSRLGVYQYPPNGAALAADLAAIRAMITDATHFTDAQIQQIGAALLARFDPKKRIRFRSSTNVEDTETFTGAGLYDSYSGCLEDDLDPDSAGPSQCDPTEKSERGVFRAIRKVYASFYNDNAFIERLRHAVDETKVGMAILVHYSSPDEVELANGVVTSFYQIYPNGTSYRAKMVTQDGAVSVTNPGTTAQPEIVTLNKFVFGSTFVSLEQRSSLVPLGAYVLKWQDEYLAFAELFSKVASEYKNFYSNTTSFTLDMEYKKLSPSSLIVKQVRTIPTVDPNARQTTFLINHPQEWVVFQGEFGNVFANHRLKSRFSFATRDLRLDLKNLGESIFASCSAEYHSGTNLLSLSGSPQTWPQPLHTVGPQQDVFVTVADDWNPGIPGVSRFALETQIKTAVPINMSPISILNDMEVNLSSDYSQPVWGINSFGEQTLVTNEVVRLVPATSASALSVPVTRTVSWSKSTCMAKMEFFWPIPPAGVSAGYTAPLIAWKQSTISGLTSDPIVLTGYYAQTYRPQHHNFSEDFLLEPRLDPAVSAAALAELDGKDILQLVIHWDGFADGAVQAVGKDGKLRPL